MKPPDEQDDRPRLMVKPVPRGRLATRQSYMVHKVEGPGFSQKSYPDFAILVRDWGERTASAYRSADARTNALYIFRSALASLPSHPTERAYLAWLGELSAHGYADGTVRRIHGLLHRLYERARNKGALWCNPLADLELPRRLQKPRKKAVLAIHDRNVKAAWSTVYDAFSGPSELDVRSRGLLAVLRYTGIRISEAIALEPQHVDLERGRIWIEQERDYGESISTPPRRYLKDDAQMRWLPLHPELLAELRRVLRLGPPNVAAIRGRRVKATAREVGYLFPFSPRSLEVMNQKLCAVLKSYGYGKTGYRWHSWRHAWALEALLNTDPPVALHEISKWLGHSTIAVTEKYLRRLRGYETPASQLSSLFAAQARAGETDGKMFSQERSEKLLSVVRAQREDGE